MNLLNDYSSTQLHLWNQLWESNLDSFVFLTSGSSGTPKEIRLTRKQLITSAVLTLNTLNLSKNDSILINLNTEYIAGKMMLVRATIGQMKAQIIEPNSNPLLNIDLSQHFDFFSFVPLQIETILTQTPNKISILNKAKAIIIGGAPISQSLIHLIQEIQSPVYHTYGMTETVSHIALMRINGTEKSDYFNTLEGVSIATDNRNCLVINHELTNNQTITTNDIVEVINPTKFKWLGRADDVINTGGIKILPNQLEIKLVPIFDKLNIKNRYFIFGLAHESLGSSINLVIETDHLL